MDNIYLFFPLRGQTGQWAQALHPHKGKPLLPGHRLPVFSGATLRSVLPSAWSLISGIAGVTPAPPASPTGFILIGNGSVQGADSPEMAKKKLFDRVMDLKSRKLKEIPEMSGLLETM